MRDKFSNGSNDSYKMPMTAHLEELRKRLLIMIVFILVAFVVSFYFSEEILQWVQYPVRDYKLVFIAPTEAFFVNLKAAFFVAILITIPIIFFQLWKFVSPGLLPKEKHYTFPFLVFSTVFFILGATFAYFVILPFGLKFLLTYKTKTFYPMISIGNYLSFFVRIVLVFGFIFELPLVIVFLTKLGIVPIETFIKARKYAVVSIFIIAAILTPPDVITQLLMALPLLLLYELSIFLARFLVKGKGEK